MHEFTAEQKDDKGDLRHLSMHPTISKYLNALGKLLHACSEGEITKGEAFKCVCSAVVASSALVPEHQKEDLLHTLFDSIRDNMLNPPKPFFEKCSTCGNPTLIPKNKQGEVIICHTCAGQ